MLPTDICRCLGVGCPEREMCRRYTERRTGGPRENIALNLNYDNLSEAGVPRPCPQRIPTPTEEER